MRPWEIIAQLEQTSARNDKLDILKSIPEGDEFWLGAQYAYDPFINFFIKKLPNPEYYSTGVKWVTFEKLLLALSNREITGNVAKETVLALAGSCTEEQWLYWYKRILSKDFSAGTAVSTLNNAAPSDHQIKTFDCQLATDAKKVKTDAMPEDAFIEAKYDGTRALWFIKPGDDTRCFSRNGKEFHNFQNIASSLDHIKSFPNFPEDGIVIDSEVISENFQALMKQARRKTDVSFHGTALVFDVMDANEFWSRNVSLPLKDRRAILEDIVAYHKSVDPEAPVELSYAEKGVNAKTCQDQIMEMFEEQLQAGFEGIMIKDANSTYNFKRDKSWLKIKPTDTFDLRVVGLEEGKPGSKYEGLLGALVVEGFVDDKFIRCNVGSGLTDDIRREWWDDPNLIMDHIVEIEADSITKAENGEHFSLRFPRFKCVREDK
jgi:DNA ligase 1